MEWAAVTPDTYTGPTELPGSALGEDGPLPRQPQQWVPWSPRDGEDCDVTSPNCSQPGAGSDPAILCTDSEQGARCQVPGLGAGSELRLITHPRATEGHSPALPGSGSPGMRKARSKQQSMEASAAVGAGGSSSPPPSPSSPPQHTESKDTELEDHCPICLESWKDPSFVMPCLHRFCYACILQWADNKTECPLCKRRMTSILHSVKADNDFVEHVLAPPMTPPANTPPARGADREPDTPNFHHPEARQQRTATGNIQHLIDGFQLPNWMSCFSTNPAIHQTLHSWFHQSLEMLFGTPRDQRARATEQQRRREGRHRPRQRDCSAVPGQEHSPSSPAPGPARSSMDEMPSTSSTAISRSPGRHTSASTNTEQGVSQGEPAPPNSTGGSHPSPRGPQRPPKRKASSTEGSPAQRRPRL